MKKSLDRSLLLGPTYENRTWRWRDVDDVGVEGLKDEGRAPAATSDERCYPRAIEKQKADGF
jgi:hypothetical protein